MASRVQAAALANGSSAAATPNALGAAATAGNLLIVTVNCGRNTDPTFQTPAGWSLGRAKIDGNTSGGVGVVFYKIAAGGDAAPTVNWTGSSQWVASFAEYAPTGAWQATPLDTAVSADNAGTSTTMVVTAAGAMSQAVETLFAMFFGTGTVTMSSPTGGFSLRDAGVSAGGSGATKANLIGTLDKFDTSIETPAAGGTESASREWAGIILAFKETTGGTTVTAPPAAASASGAAPVPVVAVSPAPGLASASRPVPAPEVRVTSPAAAATASRPVPTPALTIPTVPGLAVAIAPLPFVPFDQTVIVPPGVATASRGAVVPEVRLISPPAVATASRPTTVPEVRLLPGAGNATATRPVPTVNIGGGPVTVTAPPALAVATRPVPTLAFPFVVIVPSARAVAAGVPPRIVKSHHFILVPDEGVGALTATPNSRSTLTLPADPHGGLVLQPNYPTG